MKIERTRFTTSLKFRLAELLWDSALGILMLKAGRFRICWGFPGGHALGGFSLGVRVRYVTRLVLAVMIPWPWVGRIMLRGYMGGR